MHVVTEVDAGDRRPAGPQRLRPRLRRPGRVRRRRACGPGRVTADRAEFLGRQRLAGRPGRAGPRRAVRPRRRRARPLRRDPGRRSTSRPASETEVVFLLGQADDARRGPRSWSRRYRDPGAGRRPRSRRSRRRWDRILGAVQVRTPDPALRPAAQPLAALPGAELPRLGPVGVLPVGRRLRLPRPAPGRDGPGLRRPGRGAGADPPRGGPAVRRGRRAALVAPAGRPRRPHPHLRRPALAAARRLPLRDRDRRRRPSSTSRCRSSKAPAAAARTRRTTTACRRSAERVGHALRALRPRPRARPAASARTACR